MCFHFDPEQLQRGQSARSKFIADFQEFLEYCATAIRDIRSEANIFVVWLVRLPLAIVELLPSPIIAFAFAFGATISDLLRGSTSFPVDATHVPTFYVPKHQYSENLHVLPLMALGTIFGAIHCAGWNLPFPTYAEQKLWRVASLAVTIIPIAAVTLTPIIRRIVRFLLASSDYDKSLGMIAAIITMLAYASARLVLLGLALALLRHLPPNAFIAINPDWTKFYPHIL